MTKVDQIHHHLTIINNDLETINNRLTSTLKSISDYINNYPHLKSLLIPEFDDRKKTIFIRFFEVEIEIKSKLKIFEFEKSQNYCNQITFSVVKSRFEENEEILNIYITFDGFIVTDPTKPGSVCETSNAYRGKLILDLLLTSIAEKKIITI